MIIAKIVIAFKAEINIGFYAYYPVKYINAKNFHASMTPSLKLSLVGNFDVLARLYVMMYTIR